MTENETMFWTFFSSGEWQDSKLNPQSIAKHHTNTNNASTQLKQHTSKRQETDGHIPSSHPKLADTKRHTRRAQVNPITVIHSIYSRWNAELENNKPTEHCPLVPPFLSQRQCHKRQPPQSLCSHKGSNLGSMKQAAQNTICQTMGNAPRKSC